ncbi:MAG: AMP-binding protein [Bacteroidetes bacterium]|nr:AMP-binding protein [Bacteroidota bacterium]
MKIIDSIYLKILLLSEYKSINNALKTLDKSAFASREQLESIQREKLNSLINTATNRVPFWKKFRDLVSENSQKKPVYDILSAFPVLTKQTIRNNGNDVFNPDITEFISASTGGTTGQPLKIRRDMNCNALTKAATWRARFNWGIKPSSKEVYLMAFGRGTFLGRNKLKLANILIAEAFPKSEKDAEFSARTIEKFKPFAIEGYATGLIEVAKKYRKNSSSKIQAIVSSGEMLYDHQREFLEEKFGGKVYTYYGSNEIGSIAYECEHNQLHVEEEHIILEVVDDNGRPVFNQEGRVLVTDLDNIATPFIRYELGDTAVLSDQPCTCGKSSRVISKLIGRNQDYLSGLEDQKIQATHLAAFLKDLNKIGEIQFIQSDKDKIEVQYDRLEEGGDAELEFIRKYLSDQLGRAVSVVFNPVENITKTNRGKQPLVVRKI